MPTLLLILLLSLFANPILVAQEPNYVPNQFLVQLQPHQAIQQLETKLDYYNPKLSWKKAVQLVPSLDIWLLEYEGEDTQTALLAFLSNLEIVRTVQFNHQIELRSPNATTPNDNLFGNQWQYINTGSTGGTAGVDLDADLAWDITTGGKTASNDTIVVAVLDNGLSPTQSDFGDNIWVNWKETPNNGVDDDNNGYVDDYLGWNSTSNNDLINGGGHGTSVAGIIGAKGNNGQGVTGVNWNVKLMIIRNDWNTSEANVINAYGYALTQRKLYNESNGQKGSYVVATNASWGVNYGQPSNAPLWCAFYDTLGAYGILNIAATANLNIDVDQVGDLPTACPSDYLVAVTNINSLGYKAGGAAYGLNSIDLGSFGDGVYTTTSPNGYGTFGGTSGATPHVTGAVALLYAGACANFMTYSKIYPDSAALKMKAYLLNGVVPNVDLNGRSVSGGHLNLFNSLNNCINDCPTSDCFVPYHLLTSNVLDTQAQLNWTLAPAVNQLKYRYRIQGGVWSAYNTTTINQNSLILNNLTGCTTYEVQLISLCNSNVGDSLVYTFSTNGCCYPPDQLTATTIKSDSSLLTWQNLLASIGYILEYQEVGTSTWQVVSGITSPSYWLTNLNPCTYYDVRLKAICGSGDTTNYSDTIRFVTIGCLVCNSLSYCSAQGNLPADDYIDTFAVDNMMFATGLNGGYALFSTTPILLGKGDYHNISISQGKTFTEFVKIWLDINQDGDFNDPSEELYSAVFATVEKTKKGSIIVPATALLGVTRMRVAMRWNQYPSSCGVVDYGEVEDYCVQIIQGNAVDQLQNAISDMVIYPNPFSDKLSLQLSMERDSGLDLFIYSAVGQLVYQQNFQTLHSGQHVLELQPNLPNGVYWLHIQHDSGQISRKVVKINH